MKSTYKQTCPDFTALRMDPPQATNRIFYGFSNLLIAVKRHGQVTEYTGTGGKLVDKTEFILPAHPRP